jgi:peroxiredoxin
MKLVPVLALALMAGSAMAQPAAPPKTNLKVGDEAPDFSVRAGDTSNRQAVKLSDFRGKKNVILAFFPAAFTGG